MKPGHRALAIAVSVVLLGGCSSQTPKPRLPDHAETNRILATILPEPSEYDVCVAPSLEPPLEDQRRYLETDKVIEAQRPFWERARKRFTQLFSHETDPPSDWTQLHDGKFLPLRAEYAAQLDRLLERAVAADFPNADLALELPREVRPCGKKDEELRHISDKPTFQFYFSKPVIVGNVAFVEAAGVCGVLCGSGSLKALVKRGKTWVLLADQRTWIS